MVKFIKKLRLFSCKILITTDLIIQLSVVVLIGKCNVFPHTCHNIVSFKNHNQLQCKVGVYIPDCPSNTPLQVIQYGPPCPLPPQNLPYHTESPVTSNYIPECKLHCYNVQPCLTPMCPPVIRVPPATIEVPRCEKSVFPCLSYKYDVTKPFSKQSECAPKLNLPYRTETPLCQQPSVCERYQHPYTVQKPSVLVPTQPSHINCGYVAQTPVPKLQTCLCNLKTKIDRVLIPRLCPPCPCSDSNTNPCSPVSLVCV